MPDDLVSVRSMVDDVDAAVDFYANHFGFTVRSSAAPAFADVVRGRLRLLLSGPASSAGRPMPDGRTPEPGGWNRIHLIVEDLATEVQRLRAAGLTFRNEIVSGPGGQQILLEDPAATRSSSSSPPAPSRPASQWRIPATARPRLSMTTVEARRQAARRRSRIAAERAYLRAMVSTLHFRGQPFEEDDTAGAFLRRVLADPEVPAVTVAVAWARFRGLRRLKDALGGFRERGGFLRIIVGIDEGGATGPGLMAALDFFDEATVRRVRAMFRRFYTGDPRSARCSARRTSRGTPSRFRECPMALSDSKSRRSAMKR
jgi:catechol 2,3-dioxygenase-like lactoylglutathione lyase family enzyme